jgi:hypothetical protein
MHKIRFFLILFVFGFVSHGIVWGQQWRSVTSNDFIGSWEGSITSKIPRDVEAFMPASSINILFSLIYKKDASDVIADMRIDMNNLLNDWLNLSEIRSQGITKNDLWNIMRQEFSSMEGFTIGRNYTVNYNLSGPLDEFIDDIQINSTGDRIRIVFPEPVSFGLGDEGFLEVYLDKK